MVIEWTRGHILIQLDDKFVTVYGEGLIAEPGEVCYVVYLNSIKNYNAPNQSERIEDYDNQRIINIIESYAKGKDMKIEFE